MAPDAYIIITDNNRLYCRYKAVIKQDQFLHVLYIVLYGHTVIDIIRHFNGIYY